MRPTTTSEPSTRASDRSPWCVLRAAWAAEVVLCLHGRPRHFNALRRDLDDLPASTLSTRVRELVEAGLVVRTVRGERPARVVYSLSPRGARVAVALHELDEIDGG